MDLNATGATILVVDDDALITMNTVDLLAELGHNCVEAYSSAEALVVLRERSDIAAMMTDYAMPGMNGADLAQEARKLRPGLPVVLVTGYAELPEHPECDLPRLEKPYRLDDLEKLLNALLKRSA